MEIVAYSELDIKLNQWTWKFQDKMQEWQLKTENKIYSTSDIESLEIRFKECLEHGKNISSDTYQAIMSEIQDFYEQNDHAITLAQWRGRTEERIMQLQTEFDENATKICKDLKLRRQDNLKIEELKETNEKH